MLDGVVVVQEDQAGDLRTELLLHPIVTGMLEY